MEDTIFSKILNGQIKTDFIYEDEYCVAFHDIAPQAPVHFLVIPKTPYIDIKEATKDSTLAGHLLRVCCDVANSLDLDPEGYRIITNKGNSGGQTVKHLHFHVLGGRALTWPPG